MEWRCKWCRLFESWGTALRGPPSPTLAKFRTLHEALHSMAMSVHSHGTHENRAELESIKETE